MLAVATGTGAGMALARWLRAERKRAEEAVARAQEAVARAEHLQEIDRRRSDFVATLSHELRSPMTVVAGIADILGRRMDLLSDAERSELIDMLGREARRLAKLVSEVLDVESLERGARPAREEVDLGELAREAIADSGAAERMDGRIELDSRPGQTVFRLALPAAESTREPEPTALI